MQLVQNDPIRERLLSSKFCLIKLCEIVFSFKKLTIKSKISINFSQHANFHIRVIELWPTCANVQWTNYDASRSQS
jgi:hypothetical protein